jgi:hypothetical protein
MKLCDIVIAILIAIIFVIGILYQYGDNLDLEVKNCVKTAVTDQQLAECVRNLK